MMNYFKTFLQQFMNYLKNTPFSQKMVIACYYG